MKYTREYAEAMVWPHWPHSTSGKVDTQSCWPYLDVGPGWTDVIVHAVRIAEETNPDFVLHQVKEKFGGLRFYSDLPLVVETMIEHLALNVCEVCGEFGSLCYTDAPGPWLKTLCGDHRDEPDSKYISHSDWLAKYRPDENC